MKRIFFILFSILSMLGSHIVSAQVSAQVGLPPALQGMQVERGALMSFPSQDGSIAVIAVRVLLGDGGYSEFYSETNWSKTSTRGLLPDSFGPRTKFDALFCALNAQEHGFNCASPEPKQTTRAPYWIPLGVVPAKEVESTIAGLITSSAQAVAPAPVQAVAPKPTPVVAQTPERPREREVVPEAPIVRHEVPPPLPPRASASPSIAQTGYGIVWDDSPRRAETTRIIWDDSPSMND